MRRSSALMMTRLVTCCAVTGWPLQAVHAQQSEPETDDQRTTLEQVVVTSRRHEESLQDVIERIQLSATHVGDEES